MLLLGEPTVARISLPGHYLRQTGIYEKPAAEVIAMRSVRGSSSGSLFIPGSMYFDLKRKNNDTVH